MIHLDDLLQEPGASLVGEVLPYGVIRWELRLFRGGVEVVYSFLGSADTTQEVLMRNMIAPFLRTLERDI